MTYNPVEDSMAQDQTDVIPVTELYDFRYIASVNPRDILSAGHLMPSWVSIVPYEIGGELIATCYGYSSVTFPHLHRPRANPPEPEVPIRISDPKTREGLDIIGRRFRDLQQLHHDWDSYGGSPVRPDALRNALTILLAVLGKGIGLPAIVPTSSGGIQLEWHNAVCDIELEVMESRTSVFFSLHGDHERTWEGTLSSTGWHLDRFLKYVA